MKKFLSGLVLFLVIGLIVSAANAATIASWDMYGLVGTEASVAPSASATGINASDMLRGAGLSGNTGANSMNTKGWNGTNTDDYIEFGFSVTQGYTVTFDELWIGTRSSDTGPGTIGLYTSLDSYTNSIFILPQDGGYVNEIIDLSGLGSISGDFYVRLYEIGDTQADGDGATYSGGTFRITDHYDAGEYTDVQFTGDINPVPIPGALLLFGSGLLTIVGIRRRRA